MASDRKHNKYCRMSRKCHLMLGLGVFLLLNANADAALSQPREHGWLQAAGPRDHPLQQNFMPPRRAKSFEGSDQDRARSGVKSGRYVPLSSVLKDIRRQYPGKQLNTSTRGGGSRGPVRYEIRWLTPDGHRLDITADASTGRILTVRGN